MVFLLEQIISSSPHRILASDSRFGHLLYQVPTLLSLADPKIKENTWLFQSSLNKELRRPLRTSFNVADFFFHALLAMRPYMNKFGFRKLCQVNQIGFTTVQDRFVYTRVRKNPLALKNKPMCSKRLNACSIVEKFLCVNYYTKPLLKQSVYLFMDRRPMFLVEYFIRF